MSQPLRITFATDAEPAKRSVASLTATIVSSMATTNAAMLEGEAGLGRFQSGLQSLPGPAQQAVGALVAFEGIKTIFSEISREIGDASARLERFIRIAQTSQDLGISPQFLQSFVQQADALGTTTERLTAMLTAAREASTVRIGEGKDGVNESTFDARLRQNQLAGNVSTGETAAYRGADGLEGKIRAAVDLMDKMLEDGRRLAALDLAKTMFGADFETKLRSGVDMLGSMRKALDGLDVAGGMRVPTNDEIAKAQELKTIALDTQDTLARSTRQAFEDINSVQSRGQEAWTSFQNSVAHWIENNVTPKYMELRRIILEMIDLARQWGILSPAAPAGGSGAEGEPLQLTVRPRQPAPDRSRPLPSLRSSSGGGGKTESQTSLDAYIAQLEKARDVAKAELDTVGLSNQARARAVDLAKAQAAAQKDVENGVRTSAALTEEERNRIIAAADATSKWKDQAKELQDALTFASDSLKGGLRGFVHDMREGVTATKALGSALKELRTKIFDKGLDSAVDSLFGKSGGNLLGGLGSLIGSATGGINVGFNPVGSFRAGGGDVVGGQAYTIGERGREVFVPGANGSVFPVGQGGAGGASVTTNVHNYANVAVESETRRGPGGITTDVMVRQLGQALQADKVRKGQGGHQYRVG